MSILTVTQLNKYISFKIKDDEKLRNIMLRGEISNFKNSGHFYFTIKDKESLVKAVMFRSYASSLEFIPENGMNIIAVGSVTVFERDGVYQLNVTDMHPDGIGNEHILFEKIKSELEKEGLFDNSHKLSLPCFPKKIGVVTSAKGAALQDIINIIGRRYPVCELCIFDSLVQGADAPDSLCNGLKRAENAGCDVIIIGRGGGSYEDLKAFNDRKLAYCIYGLNVPVVSAVGHETDFTIADFVADMRAPTPSAAAEMVAPSLKLIEKRLFFLYEKINTSLELIIRRKEEKITSLASRMYLASPYSLLEKNISENIRLQSRLKSAVQTYMIKSESRLMSSISKLEALNPLSVLTRGYAVVYGEDNHIVSFASDLSVGDKVQINMVDGAVNAEIIETEKV